MMTSFFVRSVFAGSLFLASLSPALSELARENDAGQFDFYVLSLSWSPSFCATAAERGNGRGPTPQCGPRHYSFVVHGLWPQYDARCAPGGAPCVPFPDGVFEDASSCPGFCPAAEARALRVRAVAARRVQHR